MLTRASGSQDPDERTITLALAGDTMLGRGVAEQLDLGRELVRGDVRDLIASADLFVVNLECCISRRGEPWPAPDKPFFFRAPPPAAEFLRGLGVDAVTLANNHALDYGAVALLDTLEHLDAVGIAHAGAGAHAAAAREPVELQARGLRLAVVAACDHARDFAAADDRPGIAHADLKTAPLPPWLSAAIASAGQRADLVLASPHWGPNMAARPLGYVRRAAAGLRAAGATIVAGHSAHVPHGAAGQVLYDLGEFLDDYAVDPRLRNDLGLLFLVRLTASGPIALDAFPLALDYCRTRLADGDDATWILRRFATASAELGAEPILQSDRVTVPLGGQ